MKRLICLISLVALLASGCALTSQRLREPVTFYYLRGEYQFGQAEGVITAEQREGAGHSQDLTYLVAMYLLGPANESLVCPLPQGTELLGIDQTDGTVTLTISDTEKNLTESGFSVACACLTMTVCSLSGAQTVVIQSGERSVSMSQSDLLLFDDSATAVPTEAVS